MNDLERYFRENHKRPINKWVHYFNIYDRHFARFRNSEPVILEIGVSEGGSLQMWKYYFGNKARIYGIDIDPACKAFEEDNITILTGSQSDRQFLKEVKTIIPEVDILIDDGGHSMNQQIISFEELFPHIKADGIYVCEDLHTSYWSGFGGGYKRRGTFIEYSKNFIDLLNAYHSEQTGLRVNEFTTAVDSIHYYDSMLVIEKKKRDRPPYSEKTGNIPMNKKPPSKGLRLKLYYAKQYLIKQANSALRFMGIKGFIKS